LTLKSLNHGQKGREIGGKICDRRKQWKEGGGSKGNPISWARGNIKEETNKKNPLAREVLPRRGKGGGNPKGIAFSERGGNRFFPPTLHTPIRTSQIKRPPKKIRSSLEGRIVPVNRGEVVHARRERQNSEGNYSFPLGGGEKI